MAAKINESLPAAQVKFVTAGRGEFAVEVNGALLWDRKQMGGQFPDEQSFVEFLQQSPPASAG